MPPNTQLQSVAVFTPQPSSMTIVLGSRIEPWLTESLRRIESNEPLNSVAEHQTCLSKVLSSPNTIWILASLMRKGPKSESDPEFYLVDIPCDEVVFKLTSNTTDALIKYYQDVYCVDAEETEQQKSYARTLSKLSTVALSACLLLCLMGWKTMVLASSKSTLAS